jgi:hypothetical protein
VIVPRGRRIDAVWGARHGVRVAIGLIALVVILHLFQPEVLIRGRRISWSTIIVSYLSGGLAGGIVLGLTRDWYRTKGRGTMGGMLVGAIAFLFVMAPIVGISPGWVVTGIPGAVLGALLGWILSGD